MRSRAIVGALLFLVALSACGGSSPESEGTPEVKLKEEIREETSFGTYDPAYVGKGVPVLLFFKETGAVFSEASEKVILEVYTSGKALLPTYIVELGTQTGMTLKYGVFVEDTVVLLDGAGKRRGTLAHPKAAEIKIILTTGKMP